MYEPKNDQTKVAAEEAQKRTIRENIIRMALTSEARQRLANIRMVKPDIARIIEEYVIQLVSSRKLKSVIDDDQLKGILSSLQERKKDFKIRWI
jgi:programmed cell death protein 5